MARVLDVPPFGVATAASPVPDDEIAAHAEALADGRDSPEARACPPVEGQDDEIASHLEQMVFVPARQAHRRRSLRD